MVSTRKNKKAQKSRTDFSVSKEANRVKKPVVQDKRNAPEHGRKRAVSPEIESIRSQIRSKWTLIDAGAATQWMEDPDAIQQLFVLLHYAVEKWVIQYAASEPSDLARLSEKQKSTIISYLDGFCV
ncbi:hypothetical protein N8T08_002437 [Aspergillus melleus]|uniref:Uncharacterized protein n=1 Tax=Aspergillus melleus TaxID=138277 RepID=A0ACC3AM82_9EURO|nr:hypothetical protein N8T08_002437 [Aspergillus melleus]